jgi:hypothetical protein
MQHDFDGIPGSGLHYARNAFGAIALVADLDWPPRAVTMRVLDLDGREVHSEVKGDRKN